MPVKEAERASFLSKTKYFGFMKNSYLNFTTLHKIRYRYRTGIPANVNWFCYLRDNGAIAVLCQPLGQLLVQLLFSFHLRNTIVNFK